MSKLEISKMLTVSTEHITEDTTNFIDDESVDTETNQLIVYKEDEYGWFIYTGFDIEEVKSIPEDLKKLIKFAKGNDCDWLRIDRDGRLVNGLPTYNW
jgi:hypothetical protein